MSFIIPNTQPYVRPLVANVLRNADHYQWSLQGFGMLRLYLSREVRLHVWDSRFAVKGVSEIHDHPWNLESYVISGKITNTRYWVHTCIHTDAEIAGLGLRRPFLRSEIVCGPGGNNSPAEVKARGERVWLNPRDPEVYFAGESYAQRADEIHHTSYEDGTVTIVRREFLQDTEHAHVFFSADEEWVSAEPRTATPEEVRAITARALRWV